MRPMLARTYGPKFSSFPCFVQPKLNGIRALYQNGVFQSRDEKFFKCLGHLVEELKTLNLGDGILDGELYVHGWRLGRINGAVAVNRKEPTEDTLKVEYHVFDVVDDKRIFSGRFPYIEQRICETKFPHIKFVNTHPVGEEKYLQDYFTGYVALGYEGIMLRPDGPYEFGSRYSERVQKETEYRSKFLWKRKQWEDGEYVCLGSTSGQGKASIGFGALVLALPVAHGQIIPTFNVGTGFTDEERQMPVPLGKLVRVRYPYLSEDGIPQCPSFVAVL